MWNHLHLRRCRVDTAKCEVSVVVRLDFDVRNTFHVDELIGRSCSLRLRITILGACHSSSE